MQLSRYPTNQLSTYPPIHLSTYPIIQQLSNYPAAIQLSH